MPANLETMVKDAKLMLVGNGVCILCEQDTIEALQEARRFLHVLIDQRINEILQEK